MGPGQRVPAQPEHPALGAEPVAPGAAGLESAQVRICSFLPSATEIVCELGFIDALVGVSEECRWPPAVVGKPEGTASVRSVVVVEPRDRRGGAEGPLRDGRSLYAVDAELIDALRPDLIVTQDLCVVCAVSSGELVSACPVGAEVISLDPCTFREVADSVRRLAGQLGAVERGDEIAARMRETVTGVASAVAGLPRPRVFFAEWLDPAVLCRALAAGDDRARGRRRCPGARGKPSHATTWETVFALEPELVVVGPLRFRRGRRRAAPGMGGRARRSRLTVTDNRAGAARMG